MSGSFDFRAVLLKIQDILSDKDRQRLHFLLGDDVPRYLRDDPSLSGTLRVLESLLEKAIISDQDCDYLIEAFNNIRCHDAAKRLKEYQRIQKLKGQQSFSLHNILLQDNEEDKMSSTSILCNTPEPTSTSDPSVPILNATFKTKQTNSSLPTHNRTQECIGKCPWANRMFKRPLNTRECILLTITILAVFIIPPVIILSRKSTQCVLEPNQATSASTVAATTTSTVVGAKTALLLTDTNVVIQTFVDRLRSNGITVTYISDGITTYSGLPAASDFKVIILITGESFWTDMSENGQQSIVDAQRLHGTGVVITEWAGYQVSVGRWQTLSQLLLAKRISKSDINSTFTFTLTSKNHSIWTGLPKVFTTIQMSASEFSNITNGGVPIAACPEIEGTGQGVLVRPESEFAGRIVHIPLAAHYFGFNYSNDDNVITMMVNAVRWSAKLI